MYTFSHKTKQRMAEKLTGVYSRLQFEIVSKLIHADQTTVSNGL